MHLCRYRQRIQKFHEILEGLWRWVLSQSSDAVNKLRRTLGAIAHLALSEFHPWRSGASIPRHLPFSRDKIVSFISWILRCSKYDQFGEKFCDERRKLLGCWDLAFDDGRWQLASVLLRPLKCAAIRREAHLSRCKTWSHITYKFYFSVPSNLKSYPLKTSLLQEAYSGPLVLCKIIPS